MTAADYGPLFLIPERRPLTSRPDLDQKFHEFRERHPEVERLLLRYAREALARGIRRAGFRLFWERARWSLLVERTEGDGEYVLNDHLAARFSRWLMLHHPDLAGMFETRDRSEGGEEAAHVG